MAVLSRRRATGHGLNWAIRQLEAEEARTAEGNLLVIPLPDNWGLELYLKDESSQPTGSLKHRLARELVLHGLLRGSIRRGTRLIEASSGSTAVSEAYYARLLGLPFIAVVPRSTSRAKLTLIESFGGQCILVDVPTEVYAVGEQLGAEPNSYYLDQFSNATTVHEWQGSRSLPANILDQMRFEPHPVPRWIVVSAGTGGTSSAIGRHLRYHHLATRLAVVDPEGSAYYRAWRDEDRSVQARGSRVEGIGRPRVEPAFVAALIDEMMVISDEASFACALAISEHLGFNVGGSTGTNVAGALILLDRLRRSGDEGSVVSLICDRGERYRDTFYDDDWCAGQRLNPGRLVEPIKDFMAGRGPLPELEQSC